MRNLQTTPLTATVRRTEGDGTTVGGINTSTAEIRSATDGKIIDPKSVTSLNVDGMVGNFFSVNVGDDPKKVQLILKGFTELSQKKADNGKADVSSDKKEEITAETVKDNKVNNPQQE